MKNPWKTLSKRMIYDNSWIKVEEHQVITPGGSKGIYGKVLFKNKAVGIIPIDKQNHIWLVGQYRYSLEEYSWEIPMGGGSMQETILESAIRELKEETGITAKKWTNIMKIHTSNSITDEEGFVFLAEELEEGLPEFEDTEDLRILKIPFKEAVSMVMEGKITDAISVAGILKADKLLKERIE
jgi:8-oxo-dGTP pyrophosphatase MutT (NUDIX family)